MRSILRFALLTLAVSAPASAADPMLDPATDDPGREWCYLAKSTTVIGVPYQPDVTQVTYDGALYTRSAELCFFYGEPLRPLLARQKTFLDGWMPIVLYDWSDGPIRYDIEMFAAPLELEEECRDVSNTVNFVRLRMRNTGDRPAKGVFATAMRQSGEDYRLGGPPALDPTCRYEMTDDAACYEKADDAAFRGGTLIYTFSSSDVIRQAVPGAAYLEPFTAAKHNVIPHAEVCLARYEPELAPGQSVSVVFKMPRVPLQQSDFPQFPSAPSASVEKIRAADYDRYRTWTVNHWKSLLESGTVLEIPERRVQDAQRASLVHLLLATRNRNGARFQTVGLPYPDFYANDFVDIRMVYDALGHSEFVPPSIDEMIRLFLNDSASKKGVMARGWDIWPAHGMVIHSMAHHYVMTRDKEYARRIWPKLRLAVGILEKGLAADTYGLVPEVGPYDAERIKGHYTSHNLWSLLGLRSAIRMARELGETAHAQSWQRLHDEYFARFMKALQASAGDEGYVPTGLYKFLTGPAAGDGLSEVVTNCDWENVVLAYPTEVLDPSDKRVAATLLKVRGDFAEGLMVYRNGMHLHQFVTGNMPEQHLVRGDQKQALVDLYHILLHCGSTHEGFENLVRPWQDRMVSASCPPPHGQTQGKIARLVRDFLLHEYGGRAGLDESQRDLYLFPVVSPVWAKPGQQISIRNAVTEMGLVSASMAFNETGARVTVDGKFHHPPANIVVRVPYFVTLKSFTSDAKQSQAKDRVVVLSPDVTRVDFTWQVDKKAHVGTFEELLLGYRRESTFSGGPTKEPGGPGFILDTEKRNLPTPLSFNLVLEAFRHEYARRYAEFIKAGGKPTIVAAPPLSTAK